jgi:uncharacterized protein DUF5681
VLTPKRTPNPKSLKNLRQPWKKGESGNPCGRPKRPLTDAYNAQLAAVKKSDKQKRTYAELIAAAQIKKALTGNTMAAKEIADRTEGKARQALDVEAALETPQEFHVDVHFVGPDGRHVKKELSDLLN